MSNLFRQSRDFVADRLAGEARAAQMVALRLCCGMDLSAVLAADDPTRRAAVLRLERLVERERLRGQTRHWSYDLNRHIALKQAIDLLRRSTELNGRSGKNNQAASEVTRRRRQKAPS